ncbi:hypothetical protein QUB19_08950 [Microcoleus sp. B4-C5]|uniref:hypothetical protein n=1 Tax=unclassified Microcoleus TaxID=2642155 RepID=UPI002FD1542F
MVNRSDMISDIQHTFFQQLALKFFPGKSWFIFSRFNNHTVLNILPDIVWVLEVKQHHDFLALRLN